MTAHLPEEIGPKPRLPKKDATPALVQPPKITAPPPNTPTVPEVDAIRLGPGTESPSTPLQSPHGIRNPPASALPTQPEVIPTPHASAGDELAFMWNAFSNLNEWVRFSDAKAAAVLAADGIILGGIATWMSGSHAADMKIPIVALWCVSILVAVFYSAAYALRSLAPKLATSEESSSLVFFADIARDFPSSANFRTAIRQALQDPDKGVEQISQQIWANSKVAAIKYEKVSKALSGLSWAIYMGIAGITALACYHLFTAS